MTKRKLPVLKQTSEPAKMFDAVRIGEMNWWKM